MLGESAAIVLLDYYRRYERTTMCDIPKYGGVKYFIEDKSTNIEVQVEEAVVGILTSTQGDVQN